MVPYSVVLSLVSDQIFSAPIILKGEYSITFTFKSLYLICKMDHFCGLIISRKSSSLDSISDGCDNTLDNLLSVDSTVGKRTFVLQEVSLELD